MTQPGARRRPVTAIRHRRPGQTAVRGRYVEGTDGARIYVREALGPRRAPTLVLLHGLGATAALNWDRCIPRLARRYRVLAPDHRGHGRGIRCGGGFRLEDCADDVADLVHQECDGGPATVVGYSMGGVIGQLMARRHPELVSGLVLCATAGDFCGSSVDRLRFGVLAPLALASRVAPPVPPLLPDSLRHHPLLGDLLGEVTGHERLALVAAAASLGGFTSRDWAGRLTVPAVVVATTTDAVVPVERQRDLAACLGAPVIELKGGHLVAHTDPRALTTAVLRAVDRLARPRARRRLAA